MKLEFDIYKVHDVMIGIYKASWRLYWVTDLSASDIGHVVITDYDDQLHRLVKQYYNDIHGQEVNIMEEDMVWLCRKVLECNLSDEIEI